MHFVCSTFGSSGDVFPLLGLALELRRRGHEVTFATNEHFRSIVEHYQLPFEPLGTEADYRACIENPDLWHPRRAFRHVFESLLPGLKRQYEIHAERHTVGKIVGITNCFGFGAFTAQEKLGLPVITLHLQPAVMWSDIEPPALPGLFGPRWLKSILYRMGERFVLDPVVCPYLNTWRKELGLPPIKSITRAWHSPFGVLCMFPDWYAPPQRDWPPYVMQTNFPLWNHQSELQLAPEVNNFLNQGTPPIVFTPGSANLHGNDFFQSAMQSCTSLGRRGVFLTPYTEQIPLDLPETIAHFSYVPLDLILPRAAAFVHHGGIGSMSQAMCAGVPQILMPLAHDQFDNSSRVKKLGIGDFIPATRFTSARLTRQLRPLLDNATVLTACQAVARRIHHDGLKQSADAIEQRLAAIS